MTQFIKRDYKGTCSVVWFAIYGRKVKFKTISNFVRNKSCLIKYVYVDAILI